jgi:hypothetical protein
MVAFDAVSKYNTISAISIYKALNFPKQNLH